MKDSKYYDYYKAKAPLTLKELNNSSIKLVRYDEGWQEVECPEYEGQSEYKYCWTMSDVSMKTLADLETKEDSAFGYVSHLVSEVRKAAKVYRKEAASAHKERRPVRITNELRESWADAMCVIEQHNKRRINEHPGYVALKRMAWVEDKTLAEELEQYRCRYKALQAEDTDKILPSFEDLEGWSEQKREAYLDRAADSGTVPKEKLFYSKTHYTFRKSSVSEEAEEGDLNWLRPFRKYNEANTEDPIVSCVGKYRKIIITRAEENITIGMAIFLEHYYGDEFLLKTTTRDGVVTKRDIRLGLIDEDSEDDFIEWRDFLYESDDIDRALEDDSNMFEDVLDDISEEEVDEDDYLQQEDYPIEDELDFIDGIVL